MTKTPKKKKNSTFETLKMIKKWHKQESVKSTHKKTKNTLRISIMTKIPLTLKNYETKHKTTTMNLK